ncbi:MAG TPA: zf-TFIIB domain-containing protein [Gemmatimonadaceae bacterium]|nr:zf-TFIIB domain-containing protein [Gemmatimonadaceae bacterium]
MSDKLHRNEDEYFAKQDAELLKQRRAQLDADRAKAERHSHFMRCPKCGAHLEEKNFHGVKIDICPECKGTWLDAGELETIKFVDRSSFGRFIGDLLGIKGS